MMECAVVFADEKTKKEYEKLGKTPEQKLKKFVDRALDDLKRDPTCGTHIPKRIVPREYRARGAKNLWKYNLPGAWRLLYTIKGNSVMIMAIVLDWMSHKDYERLFGYKRR